MKNFRLLVSICTLILFMTGCQKNDFDDINPNFPDEGGIEINIDGGISQVQTRATADGFEDGDAVGIYVVNYADGMPGTLLDAGNQADHIQYTFIASENKWDPMGKVYYKDDKTPVDIYGYYPYVRPESVTAHPFEVSDDQSVIAAEDGLSGYEASDFLWGKTENVMPTTDAVRIVYSHRMSAAIVHITEGTGFADGEFASLSQSVLMTGATRNATIDLTTGNVTPEGTASAKATLMMHSDNSFRAIAVPQIIAANTPLFTITLDGVTYHFKKPEPLKYLAGHITNFTITTNKKSPSGDYEFVLSELSITPWVEDLVSHAGEARQYYVVNLTEAGTLGATLRTLNKDGHKIKNLKVSGGIDANDFFYIRDSMNVLAALNLSETTVKEGVVVNYRGDETIYPANEIPNRSLGDIESLIFFTFPQDIIRIDERAFWDSNIVGALIIPDGVVEIGEAAFMSCNNMTSLSLPNGLKKIEAKAFSSAFKGNLHLPYGLEYIGNEAFFQSDFTGSLELPSSLTIIGRNAFSGCDELTGSLKIPEKVKSFFMSDCPGFRGQLILHDDLLDFTFDGCSFTGELVLPKNITTINACAFRDCLFTSIAGFPETLTSIGWGAFDGCWRLSGVLTLPKDLTILEAEVFIGCRNLEGVILPEHLAMIKSRAFLGCYYLNSIVSKSLVPPITEAYAFDGVPKNNFTVEVPEQSVTRYQTADEWRLFERISAYRDFSIDRRFVRTLNAEDSKKLYLKTLLGAAWSVESKPDWVTVTPSTGTGKTEIIVTINELAKGAGMRTGQVVFNLTGTDYTQTTTVEQYDYQYGDGDVVTLKTATKGKGINIVILGDCYDAKDITEGAYLRDIEEACKHMFAVEPYKTYNEYFNVYGVFGLSEDSGVGTINNIKEVRFGTQYFTTHGITQDSETCFEYACKAPINNNISETLILLIPNTTEYAGICTLWGDGSAIAICPKSEDAYPYDFRGIVQHEAGGHGFGKLADEYIYAHYWVDKCPCPHLHADQLREGKARGWYRNLALTNDLKSVDWSHLIFHPSYANLVDVHEGGWFHTMGVFRSEPNSCMNNNIPYFSAISRQEIVERIKKLAGETFNIDDFYAKDVLFMGSVSGTSRSVVQPWSIPLPSAPKQQFPPRYMGDKPSFNPNKK